MIVNNLVSVILDLPERFYSLGNRSIYDLLKESGYFEHHADVTTSEILKELINHPRYLDHWITWSENKRVPTGWYIEKVTDRYFVGYLSNMLRTNEAEYSDESYAVANFIKLEIESIRNR